MLPQGLGMALSSTSLKHFQILVQKLAAHCTVLFKGKVKLKAMAKSRAVEGRKWLLSMSDTFVHSSTSSHLRSAYSVLSTELGCC